MNVSLTPELEQHIRTKVDSGRYLSASEVVREALRLLEQMEKRLEELRVEIQKGLDSGRSHGAMPLMGDFPFRFCAGT
jgi:antitoxin ParD1/3/4